jgi:murein L,D-transpeptidase YcbB/YkuD
MANYLLQDDKDWTPEKINEAMNSGTEKYVKLKTPIPVVITYYTAWVDNAGTLHFANDIYNHDAEIAQRIFTNPAAM